MATHGWGTDRSIEETLFSEGWRFELFQAVRLLERIAADKVPVGEGPEPDQEAVRFLSRAGFDFPASEVDFVERPPSPDEPARMTVNVLGIAGALGPLPAPYTELLLERVWQKDTAFRDFLDLFNHRLVSLLHRARKHYRPWVGWDRPDRGSASRTAFSLMGLGTEGLRGRMEVEDRVLLAYTGLIAQRPRSIVGLEVLLADYFRLPVRGSQFHGRWVELGEGQWTVLGAAGRNRSLGGASGWAALGTRYWDQEAGFELHLGPLTLQQFLDFLPTGRGFRSLVQLVRFYVGDGTGFDVRLTLASTQVPPCRLGCGPRLGWSAWLKTRDFTEDDSQVRLSGRLRTGGPTG